MTNFRTQQDVLADLATVEAAAATTIARIGDATVRVESITESVTVAFERHVAVVAVLTETVNVALAGLAEWSADLATGFVRASEAMDEFLAAPTPSPEPRFALDGDMPRYPDQGDRDDDESRPTQPPLVFDGELGAPMVPSPDEIAAAQAQWPETPLPPPTYSMASDNGRLLGIPVNRPGGTPAPLLIEPPMPPVPVPPQTPTPLDDDEEPQHEEHGEPVGEEPPAPQPKRRGRRKGGRQQ